MLDLIKKLQIKETIRLSHKRSERIGELIEFLLRSGCIFFYNFIPHVRLRTHYHSIDDENILYAVLRRHIALADRHKITNAELKEIVECIQDADELQIDFESKRKENRHLINISNGVFDIDSGDLLPHSLNYCFDYCLDFSYIPKDKRTLDTYRYFIETSIGKENEATLLNVIGLSASSIRDSKKMVLILGGGNSGKSICCELIEKGIGSEYVTNNAVHKLGSEKAVASYAGSKRVNISRDTTIGVIKEDAGFKSVISCEPLKGRLLYHNEVTVTPNVFCIAASNDFPKFKNPDDATLDRIIPIKIQGYTGEPDRTLSERLFSEKNSIFSLAVDKLKGFIASGYDFELSVESQEIIQHEKYKLHTPEAFVKECCVIDSNVYISSAEFYSEYVGWCNMNAFEPIGKATFFNTVKANVRGIIRKKVPYDDKKTVWGFYGLTLKRCTDRHFDNKNCKDNANKISNCTDNDIESKTA